MRTKLIIAVALVLLAAAAAWWYHGAREAPDEPLPEVVEPAPDPVDSGALPAEPWVAEPAPTPDLEGSPQGLYDDLSKAFDDAGRRPDLGLPPMEGPALPPPVRVDDDDGEADDAPPS